MFVLADHGHRAAGGHGGPEPEVARAPLLARAPGLEPRRLEAPVDPTRLAATFAAWLGVEAPRAAVGAPEPALLPAGVERAGNLEHARLASLAAQGRAESRLALVERQRWVVLLALLAVLMALGPIKRAYGFDRCVPVAVLLFPLAAIGLHLAIDRPLTLSAIDTRLAHGLRVAVLGACAALLAFAAARALATRGDARARTRRRGERGPLRARLRARRQRPRGLRARPVAALCAPDLPRALRLGRSRARPRPRGRGPPSPAHGASAPP
ncbi:MAG: hypothetical protein M5U28_12810 [Sandaracinaceae bacterium]|nr:hypothetical protein [Sandaracinaceae bacterium]